MEYIFDYNPIINEANKVKENYSKIEDIGKDKKVTERNNTWKHCIRFKYKILRL